MKKRILIVFLVILTLGVTATSLAYWTSEIQDPNKDHGLNSDIGEGETVITNLNLSSTSSLLEGQKLVPKGLANKSEDVDIVSFSVTLIWTGNDLASGALGKLSLAIINQKLGEDIVADDDYTTALALLDINIIFDEIAFVNETVITYNTPIELTITLEFDEPLNKEQYLFFANSQISFDLSATLEVL